MPKGYKCSEEAKQKQRKKMLGRKLSEEHKRKIGLSWRGKKRGVSCKKNKTWEELYGKDKAQELRVRCGSKISVALKKFYKEHPERKKKGKDSILWKGGLSENLYPTDWTDDLRESIRKRDGYACQMPGCGLHQDELKGMFTKHPVHHIDYDKDNCDPKNLITLCIKCHIKTNYNRDYWINFFKYGRG